MRKKIQRIEIYKTGSEYLGRLMWAQNFFEADGKTFRKDINNTDKNTPVTQPSTY
jgi:hypothetical protein